MIEILAHSVLAHAGRPIAVPSNELSGFEIAVEFSRYGAEHIALGFDHLLFLAGLSILSVRVRDVVAVVVLFAISYSSTLIGGALLGLTAPAVVIDSIIAISVGFVGAQIAVGGRWPWLTRDPRGPALVFGLAHGLGLSTLLQDLQLPGDQLLPSAVGFNIGVELGQVAVIVLLLGLLALLHRLPLPSHDRVPAGCALISASIALLLLVFWEPPEALAHPGRPPAPPTAPPLQVSEIPEEDVERYRSRVTAIKPLVPGLDARIVDGQEQLEVTWTGRTPLVVYGSQGEPMVRMSDAGIEINDLSPTAYLSSDRYAEVALPGDVDPDAPPRWRLVDSPGPIAWFEHRAQWMKAERPAPVGDGAEGMTIFHWEVPARLGGREIAIRGVLDWVPDPAAVRDRVEVGDGALFSGAVLLVALAIGALAGGRLRERIESAAPV